MRGKARSGLYFLLPVALVLGGCVSAQKFKELQAANQRQQERLATQERENEQLRQQLDELRKLYNQEKEMNKVLSDMANELKQRAASAKEKEAKLKSQLEQLQRETGGQITFKKTPEGTAIVVEDKILFDSGKAVLKKPGIKVLDKVATFLKKRNELIRIDGHTDSQPIRYSPWNSNHELGAARALSVFHYLRSRGIPESRMYISSFGPNRPVATNSTAAGRQKNRRVEILLVKKPLTAIRPKSGIAPVETGTDIKIEKSKRGGKGTLREGKGTLSPVKPLRLDRLDKGSLELETDEGNTSGKGSASGEGGLEEDKGGDSGGDDETGL